MALPLKSGATGWSERSVAKTITTVGTGDADVAPGSARSITSRNCSSFCAIRRICPSDASPTNTKLAERTWVHFASAVAGSSAAMVSASVTAADRMGHHPNPPCKP